MQPNAAGGPSVSGGTSAGTTASPAARSASPAGAPASSSSAQLGAQNRFMTQLQQNQVLASKLIGTTVVSTSNEAIGDVNDIVIDRDGRALAVVIGVGGFLGIGEKDVAVAMSELEFAAAPRVARSDSGTGRPAPISTTGGAEKPATEATGSTVDTSGPASRQQDTATNQATATTGNTGNSGPNAGSSAAPGTAMSNGASPNRIVLRMTKAELEAAPAFRTRSRDADGRATSAPKQ